MVIKYLKGDATYPQAKPPWIIAHIVNNRGGFGKGFALALSKVWPQAKNEYKAWFDGGEEVTGFPFELGSIQLVELGSNKWVANMLAQRGYKSSVNPIPVNYEALRKCLALVRLDAYQFNATVHMPRIGCGNGGGDWEVINKLIEEELQGIDVFVYDL
jgi:O-acetyl-ADP-ribose deacetylase (regulator of RNase III)